jgi:cytoplasmic iron level regulating protein YaaA (DUF328/UPF0246 family)
VDAELRGAPAAPAAAVYSGVLYDRLGLAELSAAAQENVLIASAPASRSSSRPAIST